MGKWTSPATGERPLPASGYVGYGAGEIANNLYFMTVSSFVLVYFTDVVGIPTATAGSIILGASVWGGVSDLIAGRIVDRTTTRWGRFRPFLLAEAAPVTVSMVLLFWLPPRVGASGAVAAMICYGLFQFFYSLGNVPYGSLAGAMTLRQAERARLSAMRTLFAALTAIVVAGVIAPRLRGTGEAMGEALVLAAVVFGVLAGGLYVTCFALTCEVVNVARPVGGLVDSGPGFVASLGLLRRNRPLVVVCALSVLALTAMFSLQTSMVYYARDVMGGPELFVPFALAQAAGMVLSAFAGPPLVGRFGKRGGSLIAGAVAAGGYVTVALADSAAVSVAGLVIAGLGVGLVNTMIFALQPDTVEYGEWLTGERLQATNYSVMSFMRKVGQGIGGGASGVILALGGYVAGASASASASAAIRAAAGWFPAAVVLLAVATMLAYPLTDEKYREIAEELAAGGGRGREQLRERLLAGGGGSGGATGHVHGPERTERPLSAPTPRHVGAAIHSPSPGKRRFWGRIGHAARPRGRRT